MSQHSVRIRGAFIQRRFVKYLVTDCTPGDTIGCSGLTNRQSWAFNGLYCSTQIIMGIEAILSGTCLTTHPAKERNAKCLSNMSELWIKLDCICANGIIGLERETVCACTCGRAYKYANTQQQLVHIYALALSHIQLGVGKFKLKTMYTLWHTNTCKSYTWYGVSQQLTLTLLPGIAFIC